MDIGALRVISANVRSKVNSEFVECLQEASYMEAMDLMADEEVAAMQLRFHRGELGMSSMYSLTKPEVAELYSPPRITEYGERKGILSGVAFDLTTNDEDGRPWDFCLEEQRTKAAVKIDEMRPDLLVGSPMCGPFSNLQNLNMKNPEAVEKLVQKEEEGMRRLEFCVEQMKHRQDEVVTSCMSTRRQRDHGENLAFNVWLHEMTSSWSQRISVAMG